MWAPQSVDGGGVTQTTRTDDVSPSHDIGGVIGGGQEAHMWPMCHRSLDNDDKNRKKSGEMPPV